MVREGGLDRYNAVSSECGLPRVTDPYEARQGKEEEGFLPYRKNWASRRIQRGGSGRGGGRSVTYGVRGLAE